MWRFKEEDGGVDEPWGRNRRDRHKENLFKCSYHVTVTHPLSVISNAMPCSYKTTSFKKLQS